ncbi:MAG: amidohydrolase family protein [Pseudomonadota bacterium]
MPDIPIIDAHVHLYDPARIAFPWMEKAPQLKVPHLRPEFEAASRGLEVGGAVFVEVNAGPGEHLKEFAFVTELAKTVPWLKAAVVSMPLEEGPDAVMADLEAYADQPLARGVRRLIQGHVDEPGWAVREPFVAGVQALARFDLSFDICILHPQMGDAIELVRRCPDVRFVLDHIGKPGIRDGLMEPWRAQIRELAALPNVWCKISGVVTEADHVNWREEEVRPYIDIAIEAFGFDRVMYGGDWPVSTLATTYRDWVALLDRAVSGASQEERRRLFRDNAAAFYRIDG